MRRLLITLLAITLLSLTLPAHAQDDGFYVESERDFKLEEVMPAAQPLIDRGAQVAIFLVQDGGFDDVNARLEAKGWMQGDLIRDNLIAIYVSFDPNYSEIIYGNLFAARLDGRVESIRTEFLNPNLRERQYELAVSRTLEAIETILSAPLPTQAPLSTGTGGTSFTFPTRVPSTTPYTYNYDFGSSDDSAGNGNFVLICLFIPLALGGWLYNLATGGGGYDDDDDDGNYGGPRYRSSWSSGSSSHRSSSRSSVSRGSSGGRSGGSFGRGGRSGGGW